MRWTALATLTVALLAGCAAPPVQSTRPTPTETPRATAHATSHSAAPTESPTPTPSAAPATPDPTPTATASSLDRCVHEEGIYAVTYPADWYSNGGGLLWDSWDDCSLFAPQPFADAYDPAIAIRLLPQPVVSWYDPFKPLSGPFDGYSVLRDEATTIGGREAWMREFEMTTAVPGSHEAGDRQLTYDVVIGDGWYLGANMVVARDEYDEARAVLIAMIEGLEVLAIPGS